MPFRGGEVGVGSGSGGGGNAIGKVESVVGGGDARSEVRKVVESITPEGGGGNAIEEPSVKKVVLSNGEEVGIPLETPLNPVEVQGEWVEESNEGNEGNHDEL